MKDRLVALLEQLGGARPIDLHSRWRAIGLGCWWFALLMLIFAFAGRFSKFVYVDF
jgi:hypothetical protein